MRYLAQMATVPLVVLALSACSGVFGERKLDANPTAPLHKAAEAGDVEAVRTLIGAGADLNALDTSGETALHLAVRNDRRPVVEALVQAGADVNARNLRDKTPLEVAEDAGSPEVAGFLRQAGGR